jgi:hypothetical protein
LTFIALRNEKINGKLLTFAGPRAWTTQEVITLCERLAGQDANVTTVPVSILRLTRQLTRFFEWTNDVADRLAFSEVLIHFISFLNSLILVALDMLPNPSSSFFCMLLLYINYFLLHWPLLIFRLLEWSVLTQISCSSSLSCVSALLHFHWGPIAIGFYPNPLMSMHIKHSYRIKS